MTYKRKEQNAKINWLVVGAISVIVLLLLFGGGMMGPGGMMNNWGYYSTPTPFGWIGMILMWLIPVGLIVLAIFGAVWLVRHAGNSKPPSP
jgi:uncharacterized membrane protein